MAVYLDTCIKESTGDAEFIAKALEDVVRARARDRPSRHRTDSGGPI